VGNEVAEPWQEPAGSEGGHATDPQAAVCATRKQAVRCLVDVGESASQFLGIGSAVRGQPQAAAMALKKGDAEMILQLAQLVADGTMRQMEFCGGAGDALAARRSNEDTQAAECWCASVIRQFSSHVR